jgi:hypothetical protein
MQLVSLRRASIAISLLLAAPTVGPSRAFADSPDRPPPQEAFDACQGKSTAEACSVTMQGRALDGTCAPADDNRLFCRPTRPPHEPPAPPPEAFTSCDGKAAQAACSVALSDRTLEGTCATSSDGKLFCLPSNLPPPR